MDSLHLTIGELAELLGITTKAIRHYHDIGLLPEPPRGDNGYRLYSAADLRQLQTIRRLQGYGLTLRQIHFILHSADPDADLRHFLLQRDAELSAQIDRLARQQQRLRAALNDDTPPTSGSVSILAVVEAVLRPRSTGLTDALLHVESTMLEELSRYPQVAAHIDFWEIAVRGMAERLLAHEHPLILWIERYIALASLSQDDRQAQAWLVELQTSPVAPILHSLMDVPRLPMLPDHEQAAVRRAIGLLLVDQATPLQRAFLSILNCDRK